MECFTSHVKLALTFERTCHLTAFIDKKLRGTRDIPLKVILGWTSIYTDSVQGRDVQVSKKLHACRFKAYTIFTRISAALE